MSAKVRALILQYLAAPATKSAVVERLSQTPHEAFGAILGFRGPYPKKIHPIDVHEEYLAPLLASLLKACPHLLIGPKPARIPETFFFVSSSVNHPSTTGLRVRVTAALPSIQI